MLKQTIKFKDFNNEEKEKDLYFNLTEFELVDIQADSEFGIQHDMQEAVMNKDMRALLDFIKMLVHKSYGERSADGIHFHKSPEITERFVNSAMYSPLLLSLFEEEGARSTAFVTGLMPADLIKRAEELARGKATQPAPEVPTTGPSAREIFAEQTERLSAQVRERDDQRQTENLRGAFNEAPVIGIASEEKSTEPVTEAPAQPMRVRTTEGGPESFQPSVGLSEAHDPAEQERREFEEWKRSRGQQ